MLTTKSTNQKNHSKKIDSKNKIKIGVIGFGNMAEAIIGGIIKAGLVPAKHIFACEPNQNQSKIIKKKYKISFLKDYRFLSNKTNIILIAVKPQNINEVLFNLKDTYTNQLIITVVTGIKIKTYQEHLGAKAKIIRVMPNTPALIGEGTSVYFANKNSLSKDKKLCEFLFKSVGLIKEINKESLLDVVTAVSGSGPAFVYQYAQSVINIAIKLGIPKTTAKMIVLQTLKGATQMMLQSKKSPDELTKIVTSKGGTTLAGLQVLKKKGFTKTIEACMIQATKRARELSQTK